MTPFNDAQTQIARKTTRYPQTYEQHCELRNKESAGGGGRPDMSAERWLHTIRVKDALRELFKVHVPTGFTHVFS